MSEPKDPERLLADALRAQAVFAPHVVANPADEQADAAAGASGTGSQGSLQPGTSGTGSFRTAGGPGMSGTGSFEAGAPSQTGPTTELPPNYGLLSGAGADSLARERAALDAADRSSAGATGSLPPAGANDATLRRPAQPVQNGPLPAHWVLLLAVLLGLAAGSVIGLLTLI
ncbi:hypothetical protein [Amycolatopsis orientalis]|uniref:hypothetical protein n=1 Tax=Amycolatopsis orientalis TaxID=31958 RepID=UPI0003A288D7|nr:hypothetical protein [Amycolatopsis orientalis]